MYVSVCWYPQRPEEDISPLELEVQVVMGFLT